MPGWHADAIRQFEIPDHVYLSPAREISRDDVADIEASLTAWCGGTLGQHRSAEPMYEFDESLDLDYLFALFGVPNFRVSPHQRDLLNQAIVDIGSRALGETSEPWEELYARVLNDAQSRAND